MIIRMSRSHTTRPEDYESVLLNAVVEINTESKADAEFADMASTKEIGEALSEELDALLDADVDRALRLGGTHTDQSHLWSFYEKD